MDTCVQNKYIFLYFTIKEYADIKDHSECYITCDLKEEQILPLLQQLNNDWDGDKDDCICYGFNTKMFDPLVYSLSFQYFN